MNKPTPEEFKKLHAEACTHEAEGGKGPYEYWADSAKWLETHTGPFDEDEIDNLWHRLKPTPKLRPWNPEEVPVGKVVGLKADKNNRSVIVEIDGSTIAVGSTYRDVHSLLKLFTLEDGSPCGVEE